MSKFCRRFALLIPLALCLSARKTVAQDMIGIDYSGVLFSIDSETATVFFMSDMHLAGMQGMAKDSQGRIITSSTAGHFYRVDPYRANLELLAIVPLPWAIVGIAFGPGDVLYAVTYNNITPTPSDLYTIDLASGTFRYVGTPGPFTDLSSLAYNPADGMLYSHNSALSGQGLIRIDPASGIGTYVNQPTNRQDSVTALCFSQAGTLYAAGGGLATIDLTTGKLTLVNYFYGASILGMEFLNPLPYPMQLSIGGPCPGDLYAAVTGAAPRDVVAFLYSVGAGGPFTIPPGQPCAGTVLELAPNAQVASVAGAGRRGNARSGVFQAPVGACGQLRIQALNLTTCETSNVVEVE